MGNDRPIPGNSFRINPPLIRSCQGALGASLERSPKMNIKPTILLAASIHVFSALAPAQSGIASSERIVQLHETGPRNLVITYHSPPATRAAFRRYMETTGVRQFEAWKNRGVFRDYRILFNWFVESDTFDMLVALSFEPYAQIARWEEIEESFPGGLSKEGLALGSPVMDFPMDMPWRNGPDEKRAGSEKSVFLAIPYVYYPASSLDQYCQYVEGYALPQFDGWLKDGVLRSYHIYVNRFQTSREWQALFLLEYSNLEAFGAREKEVDIVKRRLLSDPQWKALGEHKLAVRVEKQTATSFEILPGR